MHLISSDTGQTFWQAFDFELTVFREYTIQSYYHLRWVTILPMPQWGNAFERLLLAAKRAAVKQTVHDWLSPSQHCSFIPSARAPYCSGNKFCNSRLLHFLWALFLLPLVLAAKILITYKMIEYFSMFMCPACNAEMTRLHFKYCWPSCLLNLLLLCFTIMCSYDRRCLKEKLIRHLG